MKAPKSKTLLFIFLIIGYSAISQDTQNDTITFSTLNKSKLQFILDDTYFFGGYTTSGIYYSNHYKDLKHDNGFVFGVEQYFPLNGKGFVSTGFSIVQRNFTYLKQAPNINVSNLYLDIPLTTAFELPVLRSLDLRLLLGANLGLRMNSKISGDYNLILDNNPNAFIYDPNDFHRVDLGWTFGLSAEYRDFIFRARSYSGFMKLDKKDQGMLATFNFEVGYFIFRGLNNTHKNSNPKSIKTN